MRTLAVLALGCAGASCALAADGADALCDLALAKPGEARDVTTRDLVRLRDVGDLALSPDGRRVLFRVHAADEVANAYCTRWYVAATDRKSAPVNAGAAGELQFRPVGQPVSGAPAWSPDGDSFLFLEGAAGSKRLVRRFPSDRRDLVLVDRGATAFALSADGRRAIVKVELPKADAAAEQERVARRGIVYDELDSSFVPFKGELEIPLALERRVVSVALDGGDTREATEAERPELERRGDRGLRLAQRISRSAWNAGRTKLAAVLDAGKPGDFIFHESAIALGESERNLRAVTPPIRTIAGLWWGAGEREVIFEHQESGRTLFSAVDVQTQRLRNIHDPRFDEALFGCEPDGQASFLVCFRQTPLTPTELAVLRLSDGRVTEITDLNPEFRALRKGAVRKLEWTNAHGDATYGTLVLPVAYEAGRKYPLVVTTYRGGGFLRGNVGDEFPILPMAAHGMAVLSWQSTRPYAPTAGSWQDASVTLREYTSPLDSIQEIAHRLAAEGVVDADKVGICGMSYGSAVTNYAIAHSRIFAAASVGNPGGYDPSFYYLGGKGLQLSLERQGLGLPSGGARTDWHKRSAALNADRITTPLLMQYSSREYLVGMEQLITMKRLGRAVDLVIYPREGHIKKEPAHKLAAYERNLDWFRFWLKGDVDADAEKAPRYRRWQSLKGR